LHFYRRCGHDCHGRSAAILSVGLTQRSKELSAATHVQSISAHQTPRMTVTQNVHGSAVAHFGTDGCTT
jgi:hypothetical protein